MECHTTARAMLASMSLRFLCKYASGRMVDSLLGYQRFLKIRFPLAHEDRNKLFDSFIFARLCMKQTCV